MSIICKKIGEVFMKKNMLVIVLMMVFLSSQLSMTMEKLSIKARELVEESKVKGMRFYFAEGTLRDDWISQAIEVILDGSPIKMSNKRYLIQQLNIMADILVGEPLRRNQNITEAQRKKIMGDIKETIQRIIDLKCLPRH